MATVELDAKGLRCPQPVIRIAAKSSTMNAGDILVVKADCPTFEQDVRKWCERMRKTLLAVTRQDDATIAQIQF